MTAIRKTPRTRKNVAPPATGWKTIAKAVAEALDDKKAQDILVLDLKGESSMTDALIIASGTSERHLATLVDTVTDRLKALGYHVNGVECQPGSHWAVVDAGDVVVHVFLPEARKLYRLERLWAPAFDADGPDTTALDLQLA
jgi:ribosome-associated protein